MTILKRCALGLALALGATPVAAGVDPLDAQEVVETLLGLDPSRHADPLAAMHGWGALYARQYTAAQAGDPIALRTWLLVNGVWFLLDIGLIYDESNTFYKGGQEAPVVSLSWQGWQEGSRTARDTLESLSVEKLEDSGRTLAMALMILARETEY